MVKKLDIGAITDRVKGDQSTTQTKTQQYSESPDYLERRMERQSEIVKGKRERRTLYRVDPRTCRIWQHHDRDYSRLNAENCADLIEGYKVNGQIIPATVRPINEKSYQYEICAGARRHWVASYLGMDLLIEIRELTDEEMFLLSDEENRNRQDISEYERAMKYQQALGSHYKNQVQMATRMGVSEGWLSRFLDLAKLDENIVKAYDNIDSIKKRHIRDIKPLLKTKTMAEKVITEAKAMHAEPQPGPQVIKRLKAAANTIQTPAAKKSNAIVIGTHNNKPFATMKPINNHSVTIEIDLRSSTTLKDWQEAIKTAWEKHQDN